MNLVEQAYEEGISQSLLELEKTAGEEFAEKVAAKMGFINAIKDKAIKGYNAAKGGAQQGYASTKHHAKGQAHNLQNNLQGHSASYGKGYTRSARPNSKGEMAKNIAMGVGKVGLPVGAVGGAAYGANKYRKKDD